MASIKAIIDKQRAGQPLTPAEQAKLEAARAVAPPAPEPVRLSPKQGAPISDTTFSDLGKVFAGEELPPESRNLPEFGQMDLGQASDGTMDALLNAGQILGGMFLDRRPEARRDIIANTLGPDNVSFRLDSAGNEIVDINGQSALMNRPGLSSQDVLDAGSEILKFLPIGKAARGAQAFTRAAPTRLGRFAREIAGLVGIGGTGAAIEGGSQKAAQVFGSEQDVSSADMYREGALEAGGELLANRFKMFTPGAREVMRDADRLGVNLKGGPAEQVFEVQDALGNIRGPHKGSAGQPIRSRFERKRQVAGGRASAKIDEAAEFAAERGAFAGRESIEDLQRRVSERLRSERFDRVMEKPADQRLLNELNNVLDSTKGGRVGAVHINSMQDWRKGLNKRIGTTSDPEAKKALTMVRNEYDDWLLEQYNRDLLSGDKEAIQRWRGAINDWANFKQQFDEDKVLKKLHKEHGVTGETVSNWILGATQVPNNTQAGEVVRRLKGIMGADSKPMKDLRAEVAFRVSEPLFGDPPRIDKFVENYDKLWSNNRTLAKELFGEQGAGDLEKAYKLAKGIQKRPGTIAPSPNAKDGGPMSTLRNLAVRYTVGHEIAKGGARISAVQKLLEFFTGQAAGRQGRMTILRDVLGMDPKKNMLPAGFGAGVGAMESGEDTAAEPPTPNLKAILDKRRRGETLSGREQAILDQARNVQLREQDQPTGGEQRE